MGRRVEEMVDVEVSKGRYNADAVADSGLSVLRSGRHGSEVKRMEDPRSAEK